jgi:hypothetical protein
MTHNLLTKGLSPRQSRKRQGRHRRPTALSRRYLRLLERLEDGIASSDFTPFTVRFSGNVTGATTSSANALETASTVNNRGRMQSDVINAQNDTGSLIDSNDRNMVFGDVDNNPTTFNSSQAS